MKTFNKIYKFDKSEMQKRIDDNLIMTQRHPVLPLTIYNYTKHCQYERLWDDYTIAARALVLDDDFNVIARGYDKFFNYGELDNFDFSQFEKYEVVEKIDGQYIALFHYKNEWLVMSRGSFTSPFAEKAKEILEKWNIQYWSQLYTYIFELVWSEERIVVDYGGVDKLVLTGIVDATSKTHYELPYVFIKNHYENSAKLFTDLSDIEFEEMFNLDDKKSEGFVINFLNDNNSVIYKMKIKFADYVRLHSAMTKLSARNIWDDLRETGELSESFLAAIPDEMYDWVNKIAEGIIIKSENFYIDAEIQYFSLCALMDLKDNYSQSYFAEINLEHTRKDLVGILFQINQNKDRQIILKNIRKMFKPSSKIMFLDKLTFDKTDWIKKLK